MASIREWSVRTMADGALYTPPQGVRHGALRVREHVRPLEPVDVVTHRALADLEASIEGVTLAPAELLSTEEGEYAAVVVYTATERLEGRRPVTGLFGLVFGDDFCDRIDAHFPEPETAPEYLQMTRDLVRRYRLGLGTGRARRFFYDVPPGWQGLARNLVTEWYPLDFPRHHARITVAAALPGKRPPGYHQAQALLYGKMLGFQPEGRHGPLPTRSEHDLMGAILHVHAWVSGIEATDVNYPCGTEELATSVARLVASAPEPARAVVGLRNHGITATGESLTEILDRIEPALLRQVPMD